MTTARRAWPRSLMGLVLVIISLPLLWGGAVLISLGGSLYYLLAGLLLAGSGGLILAGRRQGLWLFGALYVVTLCWSLYEVGFSFWPLWPRLVGPTLITAFVALTIPYFYVGHSAKRYARALAVGAVLVIVGFGIAAFFPHDVIRNGAPDVRRTVTADGSNWDFYGRTSAGTRFATVNQITPANVDNLKVAWTFRTGDSGAGELASEDQNTPLQIGNIVYACTRNNIIYALDADTGKQRWKYDPKVKKPPLWHRCRGLGYFETAAAKQSGPQLCARRILMTTIDQRMIALDAATGQTCPGFGTNGIISLVPAMGQIKPAHYIPTSAPLVAGDRVVVGGWVFDNQEVGEPSGVIRAFNAESGALVWAWDMGAPDRIGAPGPNETYTRGTPNMWSTPSYDAKLGLIYAPMGNQTPDFWGAGRKPYVEKYAAAVVALDVTNGRPRWSYRTTLHDVWDYDVPSQPALYDLPTGKGGTTPALIQTTKRGDIFMLDRRNGKPISPVEFQRVPQGAEPGETLSPVQPRSVGMPMIGNATLTESDMWGTTLYDQLACRIAFKRMRYEGMFTPVRSDRSTLEFPGYYGGMNWGSVSINGTNDYMIVNDLRLGIELQLIPQALLAKTKVPKGDHDGIGTQTGTPFAINRISFFSPLDVPCQAPPYGTMTAIDLKTRKIAWQVPMGTVTDAGPLGMALGLPIPIGMPTIGGTMTTSSGLIFFARTQDFYLRALDLGDGRELWKARLPVGSQGTPITYRSPRTGRQFVVISAGGARRSEVKGDYIVAYALPSKS